MPSKQSCKFNLVNIWEQNIVNLENVICSQIGENIAFLVVNDEFKSCQNVNFKRHLPLIYFEAMPCHVFLLINWKLWKQNICDTVWTSNLKILSRIQKMFHVHYCLNKDPHQRVGNFHLLGLEKQWSLASLKFNGVRSELFRGEY